MSDLPYANSDLYLGRAVPSKCNARIMPDREESACHQAKHGKYNWGHALVQPRYPAKAAFS